MDKLTYKLEKEKLKLELKALNSIIQNVIFWRQKACYYLFEEKEYNELYYKYYDDLLKYLNNK